jgi:hypothetical protein
MTLFTTSSIAVTFVHLHSMSVHIVMTVSSHIKVPVTPYDNALALDQMELAYSALLGRSIVTQNRRLRALAGDGAAHPRIVRSIAYFPTMMICSI